jgi:hypothetical protein
MSRSLHARTTIALSAVIAGLGIALLVRTAQAGGGVGYLFGTLFVLAGVLRLYLSRR